MSYTIDDFHVGDIVRVRQWDDMAEEFGVRGHNNDVVNVPYAFTDLMKGYCGREFEIADIGEQEKQTKRGVLYVYCDVELAGVREYHWNTLMIEPAPPAIQFDADCFAAMLGGEFT